MQKGKRKEHLISTQFPTLCPARVSIIFITHLKDKISVTFIKSFDILTTHTYGCFVLLSHYIHA